MKLNTAIDRNSLGIVNIRRDDCRGKMMDG